jgi:hypothetical protein
LLERHSSRLGLPLNKDARTVRASRELPDSNGGTAQAVLRDLFLIPHQWMGLPLFGFGWLLIAWAVGSVGLLVWLWRHHAEVQRGKC